MPTDTAAEDAAGNSEGSESGGQRDGIEGGVPFGTGTSDVAGLPDGRAGTDALHRPGVRGVTVPELLERVDPVYPEAARKARIQGVVLLEAVITASGAVDQVRIVGSAGPILDAAASSAVRRWRYRPATLHEHPVAVLLTVTVRFGLNG
jgi:protein TonB